MEALIKALQSSNTSLAGILLGILNYAQTIGANLPTTKDEWIAAGVSIAMAAFGILAKDGKDP